MALCENLPACIYASTWVGLIWLIIIPFEIYATINLYRHRHHPGLQTRYPAVLIASGIFAMIHSLICEQFYYLESGVNLDIFKTNSAVFIARILFPPFLLIIIVMVVFRVYLIHFNINYAVSMSTRDWQSLLSDTVNNTDFYSRNRTTFGNWKYVSKYFITYILIGSVVDMFVTICQHPKLFSLSPNISSLIYVFWLFIPIVFVTYLFMKTPKFEDAYFVRKELRYWLCLCGSCLALYIAMIVWSSDTLLGGLFNEIQTSAITIANFGTVVISEYIILNKIKQFDDTGFDYGRLKHNVAPFKHSMAVPRSRIRTVSSVQKTQGPSNRKLFNMLIAHPVAINFFVKHLRAEFAIENLLCFIEFIQWIYLSTNKDFVAFDIAPLDKIEFELSSAIPVSSANNNSVHVWNWEQSILLIFKKYIHSSAEYQVNLPYSVQNGFINLVNLLKIKHEVMDKTYVFTHNKPKSKRLLFWDRKSRGTISETKTVNHATLNSPNVSNNFTKSGAMTPLSAIKDNEMTPVPKVAVIIDAEEAEATNTNSTKLEMGVFPNHTLLLTAARSSKASSSTMSQGNKRSLQKHVPFDQEQRSSHCSTLKADNSSFKMDLCDNTTSASTQSVGSDVISQNKQENVRVSYFSASEDVNGLVFIDDDDGKMYKDPEISSKSKMEISQTTKILNEIFEEEMCMNVSGMVGDKNRKSKTEISQTAKILNGIFEEEMCTNVNSMVSDKNSIIIPCTPIQAKESMHLKPNHLTLKMENSIMSSVKHSFRKIKKNLNINNNEDNKISDLYARELQQVEDAKNINVNQFISIVCQSLHIILQLNYQSISRFKRGLQYSQLLETLNLEHLIEKYGDRGC